MDAKRQRFGSKFRPTTLSEGMLIILRTEKSTSGAGDVEFVHAGLALGHERGFGGVEKELAFILGVSLGH